MDVHPPKYDKCLVLAHTVNDRPVMTHWLKTSSFSLNLKKCVFIVATSLVMDSLENVKRLAKETR